MITRVNFVSLLLVAAISSLLAGCAGAGGATSTTPTATNPGSGGTTVPGMALSAASVTFPNSQPVGATSTPITITVTNNGTANLVISSLTITGTNAAEFTVTAGTLTIAPNSSTTLNITFTPTAAGSQTATLNIADNVSGSPQTVALSGTGSVADITSLNHIIFMAQENRSFDEYFGMLNAYRAAHGLNADVDGLPGGETGTVVPDCTNWVACNPAYLTRAPIASYHYTTVCTNDYSPSWNESHVDFDLEDHYSLIAKNDGFAWTAGGYVSSKGFQGGTWDIQGQRAMGYFTDRELPYYYFMATQFATSDRFFAPAPTRSQPNRYYFYAATSDGHIYGLTSTEPQMAVPTIFDLLQNAGITWKIYYSDYYNNGSTTPDTYFYAFSSSGKLQSGHLAPITQYYTDLQNGTLPQVAMIESGYEFGLDEHPLNNVQDGARYVSKIINALMQSSSWKDSAFILTYDEGGAGYDHVAPMVDGINGATVPSPDGIKPMDYLPGDLCSSTPDAPACDFTRTGFRLPVLVVSPFTKAHFVSHLPMDYTAILKLIETRFGLPALTKRDAAQPHMENEFFDFVNVPNATPPAPPVQPGRDCDGLTRTCTGPTMPVSPCYYDHVP